MKMDTHDRSGLDGLLQAHQAPAPRGNFQQHVWRRIRLRAAAAPTYQRVWGRMQAQPVVAYALLLVLVGVAGSTLGARVNRKDSSLDFARRVAVLQPPTLAGSYLGLYAGGSP